MSYRSPKLLKSAQGQACQYCESRDGTTVSCHINSVAHGKGVGIKAPDFLVAFLCQDCHDLYDGRTGRLTKEERQDLWMRAYLRTVAIWFNNQIVGVL